MPRRWTPATTPRPPWMPRCRRSTTATAASPREAPATGPPSRSRSAWLWWRSECQRDPGAARDDERRQRDLALGLGAAARLQDDQADADARSDRAGDQGD